MKIYRVYTAGIVVNVEADAVTHDHGNYSFKAGGEEVAYFDAGRFTAWVIADSNPDGKD